MTEVATLERKLLGLHASLDKLTDVSSVFQRMQVLRKMAVIYEQMDDHAEAIECYLKALEIADSLKNRKEKFRILNKLGRLHLLHRLYPQAYNYYLNASENADSPISASDSLLDAANVLLFKGDLEEAEALIGQCHSEERPARSKKTVLRATQLKAILRNNQRRYEESLQLHARCLTMLGSDDADKEMDIRKSMAMSYFYMDQWEDAITTLDRIPEKVLEGTSKRLRKLIHEIYAACYAKLGNYEKAYHHQGIYKDVDHSITQDRVANKLTAIQVNNKLIRVQYEREMFLQRSEELAEKNAQIAEAKQKSDELLLNILPSEVAEELKERGRVKARLFPEVTVLFTDFSGFTSIAERLSPTELVDEIDACFRGFDEIIGKYGIEKIKTIGDAYMAVCGLPVERADHAEKALQAAIEMRDFMQMRSPIIPASGADAELRFKVRIGLHSGPVVAGVVGSRKFAYDVWGDTVNTASRMESSGEIGKVNVSATTKQLAEGKFHFEPRGKVAAKGKGQLEMYFVERL
ncbi:MAG: tetratricopeptide repeat protein [Bacteroidetes bacterium]|nr:MAG: tetratricopeptide repeat protein [Bacteroidota bacterium]